MTILSKEGKKVLMVKRRDEKLITTAKYKSWKKIRESGAEKKHRRNKKFTIVTS